MTLKHRQLYEISDDELREAAAKSISWRELTRRIGTHMHSQRNGVLGRRLAALNIDISHFRFGSDEKRGLRLDQLLSVDTTTKRSFAPGVLLRRLIKDGILKEECALCAQGPEWRGKPLPLQMHYRNNDVADRRLENLLVLCPNCRSQEKVIKKAENRKPQRRGKLKKAYAELLLEEGITPKLTE